MDLEESVKRQSHLRMANSYSRIAEELPFHSTLNYPEQCITTNILRRRRNPLPNKAWHSATQNESETLYRADVIRAWSSDIGSRERQVSGMERCERPAGRSIENLPHLHKKCVGPIQPCSEAVRLNAHRDDLEHVTGRISEEHLPLGSD